MRFISLAIVAVSAMLQVQTAALTGTVTDADGAVLPGATVKVAAAGGSPSTVTDTAGRFHIDGLAAGSYDLTVSLPGFRTQTVSVRVGPSSKPELVVLLVGIMQEILWVVPSPPDAYRKADAIAHLRVDRNHPDRPCGDDRAVTARHDASVLRLFKGTLPAAIRLEQEAAGRCSEQGKWMEGFEDPYKAGEEYVVFLRKEPDGYGRLAGRSLAFRVRGQQVTLEGFAGVKGSISLDQLAALLDNLSRSGR